MLRPVGASEHADSARRRANSAHQHARPRHQRDVDVERRGRVVDTHTHTRAQNTGTATAPTAAAPPRRTACANIRANIRAQLTFSSAPQRTATRRDAARRQVTAAKQAFR